MRDGTGWRRAVPSPMPRRIREINTIRFLLQAGVIVIYAGGGGITVAVGDAGELHGVEAVIDKDFAAALLAEELEADWLLLLTDIPAVWTRWPMSEGSPIGSTTAAQRCGDPGARGNEALAARSAHSAALYSLRSGDQAGRSGGDR